MEIDDNAVLKTSKKIEVHAPINTVWKLHADINSWEKLAEIPVTTAESDKMSKELKQRGFKFVGSTICYAFMQAVGMVNDHVIDCFRYEIIKNT